MTARKVFTAVGWVVAACWLGFTLDMVIRSGKVSSAQWKYLMSVPGGHWSWVGVFLTGSLLLAYGLTADSDRARAVGCAVLAFGCGFIAAFYIAAPFIDPGLTTLGYWTWVFSASILGGLSILYAKPPQWLT